MKKRKVLTLLLTASVALASGDDCGNAYTEAYCYSHTPSYGDPYTYPQGWYREICRSFR